MIYSKDKESHLQHLHATLQLLRQNSLFAKLSKCVFGVSQVEYLGHVLSKNGVATDPAKIQAVANWPTPTDISQLRSVLGLFDYYRRFIEGYGVICRPLHDLLKKGPFVWGNEQEIAFQKLKKALITAPVLALPDFQSPFVLETDASGTGIGSVIM